MAYCNPSSVSLLQQAEKICEEFTFTDDDGRRCANKFIHELKLGIKERSASGSQMIIYVTKGATGKEKGIALELDLGGTNLRVCSVELEGDETCRVWQSQIPMPHEIMVSKTSKALFGFLSYRIQLFLEDHRKFAININGTTLEQPCFALGFSFSVPAYQAGINSGILLRWTKGYDIPETVNQDVCALLQTEIDLLKLPVKVTAIINDALGAIMSRAYTLPLAHVRPTIGAIFGTGINGVYLQSLGEITKPLEGQIDHSTGAMFMSTEWGSFDNQLSIMSVTRFDAELNSHSINPGNQIFEKETSGMFLGELLRLAVLELYCDRDLDLFLGHVRNAPDLDATINLRCMWSTDASILSVAEADQSGTLDRLREKTSSAFEVPQALIRFEDALAVQRIANAIGRRGARLAGTAVGSVIVQSGTFRRPAHCTNGGSISPKPVDVAIDGSVAEHYPGYEDIMRNALEVIPEIGDIAKLHISIGHAKDGSSVGAAIVGLIASYQMLTRD